MDYSYISGISATKNKKSLVFRLIFNEYDLDL